MKLRKSLFRKYLGVLTGLITGTLIVASLVQVLLNVREQRLRVGEVLGAESRLAALQTASFLSDISESMGWVLDFDQPGLPADLPAIRDESQRLLRKSAAIMRVRYIDGAGCGRVQVSRVDTDREDGCATPPAPDLALARTAHGRQVAYGTVQFRDGSEPFMDIALAARGKLGGVLIAEVDLRQIHDTVTAIHIGKTGFAYIADQTWHLVAHPDESMVLRHLDLRGSTVIRDALASGSAGAPLQEAMLSTDSLDHYVLSAMAPVPGPNWWVVVQQPAREAFAPIIGSLWAAALVVLIAIIGAVAASSVLARRMASPILAMRSGAEKLAAGDLSARIELDTGDEVELLANEFNRMAETLDQSYAQLEAKVRQRTQALAEAGEQVQRQATELSKVNGELSVRLDELAVRKDEAERASAAKTRFLAAASHDLMQPMHAVSLLVGILRKRIHYPEVSNLVVKVQSAVHGMETLFASLLDISKLDSGAVRVDLRTVELQDLLRFVEVNYHPLAQEKGIVLRVARCRAAVLTDPGLLDRIIGNLVTNAIRYTTTGTVLVGCRRVGKTIRVQVCDTGEGIPEHYQSQIFEEFFQIGNPDRDRGNGLGLGLSIVKRSAELLGHPLSLRSAHGRGSVFSIDLPCVADHAPAAPVRPNGAPADELLRGAFVVLVDDDGVARYAMEHMLHLWGCHVIASTSLADAMRQLEGHLRPPDLILTDLRLGQGSCGMDVIAAIREESGMLTPAVIVTGESRPLDPATLPPHCVVLKKPARPARMYEVCAEMLSAHAVEPDPAVSP